MGGESRANLCACACCDELQRDNHNLRLLLRQLVAALDAAAAHIGAQDIPGVPSTHPPPKNPLGGRSHGR